MHEHRASLRCFFAFWPDADTRLAIARQRDALSATQPSPVRPMRDENLHLTLVFLGNINQQQLHQAQAVAEQVRAQAFEWYLDRYGYFPRPKVLHYQPSHVPAAAVDCQHQLNAALQAAGLPHEQRSWVPHVTLLRKVTAASAQQASRIRWRVAEFVLVVSRQQAQGVVYEPVGRWPLLNALLGNN